MTVCNRCGKENQDHYKFCLGCGAELTAAPKPGGDMAMMKTMMADTGAPGGPLAGLGGMPGAPGPLGGVPGGPGPGGMPGGMMRGPTGGAPSRGSASAMPGMPPSG